jgi:heme exporter protein C
MDQQNRSLIILDVVTAILFIAALAMVFIFAPVEAVMGLVQKVFYFHVASAWVGMLSFLVAAVAGIIYLRNADRKWDIVSLSSVEIGLVFAIIAIISGSIWAKPIWNTWWTWDPRLTTTAIMALVYAAYLMLRAGLEDPDRRARISAVYSIIGAVSVPLTFFSIRIFRTIHPVVIGSGDPTASGSFDMAPKMLITFIFSLIVFTVLFVDLLRHRVKLGQLADEVEQDHLKLMSEEEK